MQEIFTFIKSNHLRLKVESNYLPGIPKFTLLDFGPSFSKELSLKIRSALASTGFKWSLKKQALFSIEKSLIIKTDQATLDLPIVLKYLVDTRQIELNFDNKRVIAFGEITIHGKIKKMHLESAVPDPNEVWIGNFDFDEQLESSNVINVSSLKDLFKIEQSFMSVKTDKNYSLSFMDLLMLHGHHSKLVFNTKNFDLKNEALLISHFYNINKSIDSRIAFLHLSENINYSEAKKILCNESKKIVLVKNYSKLDSRLKESLIYSRCDQIVLAQTSLCPCGKAELKKPKKCGFSLFKCRSVLESLSHSGLSEFDIFQVEEKNVKRYEADEALNILKQAEKSKRLRGQKDASVESLKSQFSKELKFLAHLPSSLGKNRLKKCLRLSRSVADLNGHEKIEKDDLDWALRHGFYPLKELVSMF